MVGKVYCRGLGRAWAVQLRDWLTSAGHDAVLQCRREASDDGETRATPLALLLRRTAATPHLAFPVAFLEGGDGVVRYRSLAPPLASKRRLPPLSSPVPPDGSVVDVHTTSGGALGLVAQTTCSSSLSCKPPFRIRFSPL